VAPLLPVDSAFVVSLRVNLSVPYRTHAEHSAVHRRGWGRLRLQGLLEIPLRQWSHVADGLAAATLWVQDTERQEGTDAWHLVRRWKCGIGHATTHVLLVLAASVWRDEPAGKAAALKHRTFSPGGATADPIRRRAQLKAALGRDTETLKLPRAANAVGTRRIQRCVRAAARVHQQQPILVNIVNLCATGEERFQSLLVLLAWWCG
jgi:hypothetical protein